MRNAICVLLVLAVLSSPGPVHGQVWTPEQQELVDHLRGIWDQVEENNEATFSIWRDTVHPKDDMVWWFTDQGAPYDLKSLDKGISGGGHMRVTIPSRTFGP